MNKDTVRFDAFVNELRALETRHGLHVNADDYEIYVDVGANDGAAADIRNDIRLPPPPILGDVPHEVITAVFRNHVRHGELPSHWLETILRVYWTAMGHDAIEAASEHRPSKWVEQPGSMFRGLLRKQ